MVTAPSIRSVGRESHNSKTGKVQVARVTKMKLLKGPCDPRAIEMVVTADAQTVSVRPMPYDCHDIYTVTDRFLDAGEVVAATGEHQYTAGSRKQIEQYRRSLCRLGTTRAFRVKRAPVTR
jgi:hypothetical protein